MYFQRGRICIAHFAFSPAIVWCAGHKSCQGEDCGENHDQMSRLRPCVLHRISSTGRKRLRRDRLWKNVREAREDALEALQPAGQSVRYSI